MKIPLFDNDGTLLKGGSGNSIHNDSFVFAFKSVYNVDANSHEILTDGMLDNEIIVEIVKKHGVPEEKALAKLPQAIEAMNEYFHQHESECDSIAQEGAEELLKILKSNNILIGVLTGNIEDLGWGKLKAAGLRDYIDFGSFGNLAMKRMDLIEIAQKRFEEKFSTKHPITDFVIVGDTPKDIQCARDGGIQVIAVATGNFSREQLEKENPDLLIDSLNEHEKILQFLK